MRSLIAFFMLCACALQAQQVEIPTATPAPPAALQPDKANPRDCLIVATIAYHRLQQAGVWAEIVGLVVTEDGVPHPRGHAVVLFQASTKSQIFLYDESGSVPIGTTSRKAEDVYQGIATLLANRTKLMLANLVMIVEDSRK